MGGYERISGPSNIATGGLPTGTFTGPPPGFGDVGNDPTRTGRNALSQELLRQQADEADIAEHARRTSEMRDNPQRQITPFFGDPSLDVAKAGGVANPWRNFFQALKNQGVDELQSGAAGGMDQGAFERMPGDPNASADVNRSLQQTFAREARPGFWESAGQMTVPLGSARQQRLNQDEANELNRLLWGYQRDRRANLMRVLL